MRLKIQRCINKAHDTPPSLDAHSSAEVVKGSSAPAYKRSLTLQNTSMLTSLAHMSERTTHFTCVCVCVCSSCVALTTLPPFPFLFALGAKSGLTPTQEQESEQREDGERHRPRLFISPRQWTTPTALPPALTCQAAKRGLIVLICGEGRKKHICELQVWGQFFSVALVLGKNEERQ